MGVIGLQSVQVELEADIDLASLELAHDPMLNPGARVEQVVVGLNLVLGESCFFVGIRLRGSWSWHRGWPSPVGLRVLLPQRLGISNFSAKNR